MSADLEPVNFTAAQLRQLDAGWKSDFDKRLGALTDAVDALKAERESQREAMQALTKSVDKLNEVLASGNGALAFLFLMAKVLASVTVIFGAIGSMVYVAKTWPK